MDFPFRGLACPEPGPPNHSCLSHDMACHGQCGSLLGGVWILDMRPAVCVECPSLPPPRQPPSQNLSDFLSFSSRSLICSGPRGPTRALLLL